MTNQSRIAPKSGLGLPHAIRPHPDARYRLRGTRPADGAPVVLLHGFPYDSALLRRGRAAAGRDGCRVLVPYLRGYGPTRFLSAATPRSGEQAALGNDLLAVHGRARRSAARCWWATTGAGAPPAWSRRCGPSACAGLVSGTGYNIQDIAASVKPAPRPSRSIGSGTSITSTPSAAGRPGREPPRRLPAAVAAVVAELGVRRGDLRGERRRRSTIRISWPS